MGTKMAVAFANIFIARIERQTLSQSCIKPLFWKRYIDDVFSLWNTSLDKIESFVKKANNFPSTIKQGTEQGTYPLQFFKGVYGNSVLTYLQESSNSSIKESA